MFISPQQAQSIVNEMKASIHRDINIMDRNGIIIASTDPARRGQCHQGAARIIVERLPLLNIYEDDESAGVRRGINLPITLGGALVGVIGVTGEPDEVSVFGEIIKRMTEIMVESAQQKERTELTGQAKGMFVENWLFAENPDWQELELRGRLLGIDINAPYTVALLKLKNRGRGDYARAEDITEMRSGLIQRLIQTHIQDNKSDYCAVMRSGIIVLLNNSTRENSLAVVSRICRDIERSYPVRASGGVSGASSAPKEIRRCYVQAQTACMAAAQSSKMRVVFHDEISLELLIQSVPRELRQNINQLVFSRCSPKDREEYVNTIITYFDTGGDIKRCAQRLYIHRNTFQYRLDCVYNKTGYNIKDPRDATLLYIAATEEK